MTEGPLPRSTFYPELGKVPPGVFTAINTHLKEYHDKCVRNQPVEYQSTRVTLANVLEWCPDLTREQLEACWHDLLHAYAWHAGWMVVDHDPELGLSGERFLDFMF